jgi:hypothetical protein
LNKLNRLFSLLILAVSLSLTGVSSASATDYYVSTAGSDSSGDGSSAHPWATIAYASTRIGPGATVHVAPGTYTGSFNTRASGASSAYVTYISDTKWGAKIVAGSGSTWSNYGAYVTIQGFDVSGPTKKCCEAIYTSGNATKIIGNNVHGARIASSCTSMGGAGIDVEATNVQVIGNYVHHNGPYPSACQYIHGIYIASSDTAPSSGAYVANNISFQNAGWGIQLWHDATNETLVNNTIFGNLTGGIVVGAGVGTDDFTVVNNNLVYNNPGTDGGMVEEGTTGTHNTYTDNLVFGNTPVNISLQNGLTATRTVSANPLFVNYTGDTTGDYRLQSSSPAINAGTTQDAPTTDYDGNTRPQGGAWDIGAYEYGSSTSTSGAATLSPTSLTFPSQTVGTTSAVQLSTLTNSGSTTLTINSVTVSGDFALAGVGTCGTSLAAGTSCTISVNFTPTTTGTRMGTITVTDSATGSPQTIPLSGSGVSSGTPTPAVSLSPSSLSFGNQVVGTTSAVKFVTLTNTGNATLTFSGSFLISSDFAFGGLGTCGSTVAAGASCTISVKFTPTATGARTGAVTLNDNAPNTPQKISLSGNGT